MALDPKVRSAGLHLGTASATALAVIMWTADHKVDLYAIMDQLNEVAISIGKLVALVAAIGTGIVQVVKSTDKSIAVDVKERAKDEASPLKGIVTKDTPEGHEMAASIPGPVVAAGTKQADILVKGT